MSLTDYNTIEADEAMYALLQNPPPPPPLPPGTRARKVGGNYQATGEIVASWIELDGKPRYVFRFDEPRGLLHIFTAAQVEAEG